MVRAGRREWVVAIALVAFSAIAFIAGAPFARTPLPKVLTFIPTLEVALAINDFITAVLLISLAARQRSRALLVLACGYLFSALMTVVHALSFPGGFAATGLFGGNQTTAWLYTFWHGGFPLFVLAYALLPRPGHPGDELPVRPRTAVVFGIIAVIGLIAAVALLVTAGHDLLPVVIVNGDFTLLVAKGVSPTVLALSLIALIALWRRPEPTVLDLWIMVVMCVWVFDVSLSAVIGSARYDLGWYGGRIYGLLASCLLLTLLLAEMNRVYGRLAGALTEMRHAKVAAERANEAKSDFLSRMSHELRTPLNAILGFAQAMETGTPPPTASQKECIDEILRGGWYLLELINEILDLALIEAGQLSLSKESVSLGGVLLDCQAMMEPQARKRGIHMTFPQFDEPCFVHADRTRVKQLFINLLSNAIKYNRPNGAVVVSCGPGSAGRVRVTVSDTGRGLSKDKLEQLFQPFNRLGQEASSEEGTGIGLVVTKRLVEHMGGTVGAESTVGVGTTFWVELLSAAPPEIEVGKAEATLVPSPVAAEGPVRTLLYVEDNPANLKLVEQLIARRPDMRLLTASDGPSGIETARSMKPDLILMDINLPGMSGIKALQILRDDPATMHIPVVALSANAMQRDIDKGLAAGFFRYLTKPIKVAEFMATVDADLVFAGKTAASNK